MIMSDRSILGMLELAKRLAKEAAGFSLPHAGRAIAQPKSDRTVVTAIDHEIQERIVGAIAAAHPDHAVVAEESLRHPEVHVDRRSARYCWVIDPLDGTRNLVAGFPCFATSIAVLERGWPIAGVIYEHNLGHCYVAVRGSGATLNEKPLAIAEPPLDEDLLIGVASTKDRLSVDVVRHWVAAPGLICRNIGAAAVHLAMVASGALAAAFCKPCKIWDVAAGGLLVLEAGGVITTPFGDPRLPFDLTADPYADIPFLAGARNVHAHLLARIKSLPAASER